MHSAPPVLVPVGRFVGGRWVLLALSVLAALACVPSVAMGAATAMDLGLMAVFWCVSVALSCWLWRSEAVSKGELSWDGQAWWFRAQGAERLPAAVALCWDLDHVMVLQLSMQAASPFHACYACLQASQIPSQWHSLRCAVHAGDTL